MGDTHSLHEAAKELGVDEQNLVRDIEEGKLQAHQVGDTYMITRTELESYLKRRERVDEQGGTGHTDAGPASRAGE